MTTAKLGVFLPTRDWASVAQAARWADEQGFHSVSLNDHFVSQDGGATAPQLECLSVMTGVAAITSRVRLVPTVIAASYRTPAMLAKATATIDQISGGRFTLGIGAGWNVAEYTAHGYPFPDADERLDQLEETIEVVKAMWGEGATDDTAPASHHGRHFQLDGASTLPRPIQQPRPPIMIGGSSNHLLAIAARHADIVNLIPPTAHGKDFIKDAEATVRFDRAKLRQRVGKLHSLAEAAGRDPAAIEISGFALANLSHDPDHPTFERLARRLGFSDLASAQSSPVALIGTPEQALDELRTRIDDDGVSYFIVVCTSPETQEILAGEILPALSD